MTTRFKRKEREPSLPVINTLKATRKWYKIQQVMQHICLAAGIRPIGHGLAIIKLKKFSPSQFPPLNPAKQLHV